MFRLDAFRNDLARLGARGRLRSLRPACGPDPASNDYLALERSLAQADHGAALRALRRSLSLETGCAVTVLFLVAWLGALEPAVAGM
jgi:hypothetical protein